MFNEMIYIVTIIVIATSTGVTLYFKNELERMFREKKTVLAFHFCNIIIITMVALVEHAVLTIYVIEQRFIIYQQIIILLGIILPFYFVANSLFERYKTIYCKYMIEDNGKVIVLNEKYLKRRRKGRFQQYHTFSRGK